MRPLALGWTAYLFGINILFLITRGSFHSPDSWAELYTLILLTYAGAPEVKQWIKKVAPADQDTWLEKVRKGGPLVIAWNLLLAAAGALRMYDPTWPMPPELKSTAMQVTALFFGTYAVRQLKNRALSTSPFPISDTDGFDTIDQGKLLAFLKEKGPSTPAAISAHLAVPRRSLSRALSDMLAAGQITRRARYPTDPAARYAAAAESLTNK